MEIEPIVRAIIVREAKVKELMGRAADATGELNIKKSEHVQALAEIGNEMDIISKPYEAELDGIMKEIQSKKDEITGLMTDADKKTVELDIATVQLRVTKSVKILNKVGLVKALVNVNDGIENGIKSFALPHIRKLMEVGVVTSVLAEFEETRRVKITARKKSAEKKVSEMASQMALLQEEGGKNGEGPLA